MRFIVVIMFATVFMSSCGNSQTEMGESNATEKTMYTAEEFSEKLNATADAQLLDVRTPDEFAAGHLERALNYDWNGSEFAAQIAGLDKTKPIFIYCLSGGRSGAAAKQMRSQGFQHVYELQGGIMKWRAAGLPETRSNDATPKKSGMTKNDYDKFLKSDKKVVIDFYAVWCAPCKRMEPYLKEITVEMKDEVEIIRIDADANQELCQQLGVDALPTIKIYENGKEIWSHVGYVDKEGLLEQLK